MRPSLAWVLGAALVTLAAPASAQEAPRPGPGAEATPGAQAAASRPQDPPYDPAKHGGMPYGTYIRITRARALQSVPMMVVGILLVAAGNAAMGIGTGIYAGASPCTGSFASDGSLESCGLNGERSAGIGVFVAGTLLTALGVPLWVLGETSVPRVEAGGLPAMRVGPSGASLTWSF